MQEQENYQTDVQDRPQWLLLCFSVCETRIDFRAFPGPDGRGRPLRVLSGISAEFSFTSHSGTAVR